MDKQYVVQLHRPRFPFLHLGGGRGRRADETSGGLWAIEPRSLATEMLGPGVAIERVIMSDDGKTAIAVGDAETLAIDTVTGARPSAMKRCAGWVVACALPARQCLHER